MLFFQYFFLINYSEDKSKVTVCFKELQQFPQRQVPLYNARLRPQAWNLLELQRIGTGSFIHKIQKTTIMPCQVFFNFISFISFRFICYVFDRVLKKNLFLVILSYYFQQSYSFYGKWVRLFSWRSQKNHENNLYIPCHGHLRKQKYFQI